MKRLGFEKGALFAGVTVVVAIVCSIYAISIKKDSVHRHNASITAAERQISLPADHVMKYGGYKMAAERSRVGDEIKMIDWTVELEISVE